MKEARLYIREDLHQEDSAVVCALCHHRCRIRSGRRGRCGVRENQGGVLSSLVELISRTGFTLHSNRLENGRCPKCREGIEGVWSFPLHDVGVINEIR